MAEPGDPVLQVRITLRDVDDPPVWRQVLIPAAYPLSRVHRVIQAAMGWGNSHMHAFQVGKISYGPDPEGEDYDPRHFDLAAANAAVAAV